MKTFGYAKLLVVALSALLVTPAEKAELIQLLTRALEIVVKVDEPPPVDPPPPPPPPPPAVELESAPEGAVRVASVDAFKAALLSFHPIIAVQNGVYDMGDAEWRVDYNNPKAIRILGGYNADWQRPKTLPSPHAKYDPNTGDTTLPVRLQSFLDTGAGETVILRSGWQTSKVGQAVWAQIRGELNRVTFVGTRNAATDQAQVFQGNDRSTLLLKDCMSIQRYSNSHGYLGFNYLGGQGSVVDGCIFYMPFTGATGNCRPQFLIGSTDSPASLIYDQHTTLRNSCLLLPISGGYHRLGFVGGTTIIENSQFLSPNALSYLNMYSPRQLGVVASAQPGVKDVDWKTEWRDNEFVMSRFTISPSYHRKLLASGNRFYLQKGCDGDEATLWADQAMDFGASNVVRLEQGQFNPPQGMFQQTTAARISTRAGGRYEYQPVWKEGNLQSLPVCIDGDGEAFNVTPTIQQGEWKPVRYTHLTITGQQLFDRLKAGGEAECVKVFDEQYPALRHLP